MALNGRRAMIAGGRRRQLVVTAAEKRKAHGVMMEKLWARAPATRARETREAKKDFIVVGGGEKGGRV